MVEFAHMKPHKDIANKDDMARWAWMMGYAYRGTFHIDCRLNLMPLNIYIHRLLDAHLVTFLLDENILKLVEEKLRVNASMKTATDKRQRILTDLYKEMPEGGWPVILMATNKCDKTEALMVHDMGEDSHGRLCTAETYQVFKHPFAIPFKTSANPIFILANMQEQQKNLSMTESHWYDANWEVKQWEQFIAGTSIITDLVENANVPECFKERAARETRRSSRGEAVLGIPQDKYDYHLGKYEAEKSTAEIARSNSDNPENEHQSDSEEESELDGKEPSKNLFVHPEKIGLLHSQLSRGVRLEGTFNLSSSLAQLYQLPEPVSDDADDESSSEYPDDETGSKIGRRGSPLQHRSRSHRPWTPRHKQ
ncbi:hypothetical protein C0993_000283 [Termitomyces sp. T159_Od127]|nr:hypothetical protein C0993_000283 [Termitomyces sp. T159_Od127]